MNLLNKTINSIIPISKEIILLTQKKQDNLTKPRGAFGRLEDLSIQIAGAQHTTIPKIVDKVILLFAADHNTVHEEGISSAPVDVTSQMIVNFVTTKGAGINILADLFGARLIVTDMGVSTPYPPNLNIINKSIRHGASNITKGPAMTKKEAILSLESGIEVFNIEKKKGIDILAIGEMGIGNTTPSSAIISVVTRTSVESVTGPGAGIIDIKIRKKIDVIKKALEINIIDISNGIDILTKVGGFEIGAMSGAMLAAAASKTPVMIDGFIATAAALIAIKIAPDCEKYLISAHSSAETGHSNVLDFLNQKPLLDLGMRLGEGTGAILGISLAEAAVKILNNMSTFESAEVTKAEERNSL